MERLVVGLMSGTSMDGIDAALVEITGRGERSRVKSRGFVTTPYPKDVKRDLLEIDRESGHRNGTAEISALNFKIGELFAQAAIRVVARSGRSLRSVDLIGSHGQTVFHNPKGREKSTLQLGEPAVIAERTGVTTVADFRTADVAAGGEGAPLTPYVHYLLFRDRKKSRAIHNLGGISNLTYIPARAAPRNVVAFDTGPGNMIIDGLVRIMTRGKMSSDRGGAMAKEGDVNGGLLRALMRHPFYSLLPPKSTGREAFGASFVASLQQRAKKQGIRPLDLLATATALSASTIVKAYAECVLGRLGKVDEIYFAGGGRKNRTLMKLLRNGLDFAKVGVVEDLGVDGDALEAQAFAVMANETVEGVRGNLPRVTGAGHPVILGKVVPGKNYLGVRLK